MVQGDELYTHYDKVESSVRERYEKFRKQKKTTQKKTVTTKKSEVGAYADNKEKTVTDIHSCGCSVSRVSWLSDKWCVDGRDAFNEFMNRFNEVCAVPFANYYNSIQ